MPLDEYTFQLRSTGTVLNSDVSVPFVDIERVSGLDSAPFRETMRDHEGHDGGFIDAEFEQGRDIIIEGMVYADVDDVESYLDTLKGEFGPITTPVPLYFKSPGVNERFVNVKPRGARYDWETARRTGRTPVQFLMYAEDPRFYDNELLTVVIPFGGDATTGIGFTNVTDSFTRTVGPSDWGTATTGEVWNGTSSQLSTNGTTGRVTHDAAAQTIVNTLATPTAVADATIRAAIRVPVVALGGIFSTGIRQRIQDASNYYMASLSWGLAGALTLVLTRNVAGSLTTVASTVLGFSYTGAETVMLEFEVMGYDLRAKAWLSTSAYPLNWTLTFQDTTAAFATGTVGIRSRRDTGNVNGTTDTIWDDFYFVRGVGFNLNFGATVPPNGQYVTVTGNRPAPALLTIEGPLTNPRIINETDGKTLAFEIVLGALDVMAVDLAHRTVVVNGTTNRRDALLAPDWFLFNPGDTFIKFGGGAGSGSLIIEYRNAWR